MTEISSVKNETIFMSPGFFEKRELLKNKNFDSIFKKLVGDDARARKAAARHTDRQLAQRDLNVVMGQGWEQTLKNAGADADLPNRMLTARALDFEMGAKAYADASREGKNKAQTTWSKNMRDSAKQIERLWSQTRYDEIAELLSEPGSSRNKKAIELGVASPWEGGFAGAAEAAKEKLTGKAKLLFGGATSAAKSIAAHAENWVAEAESPAGRKVRWACVGAAFLAVGVAAHFLLPVTVAAHAASVVGFLKAHAVTKAAVDFGAAALPAAWKLNKEYSNTPDAIRALEGKDRARLLRRVKLDSGFENRMLSQAREMGTLGEKLDEYGMKKKHVELVQKSLDAYYSAVNEDKSLGWCDRLFAKTMMQSRLKRQSYEDLSSLAGDFDERMTRAAAGGKTPTKDVVRECFMEAAKNTARGDQFRKKWDEGPSVFWREFSTRMFLVPALSVGVAGAVEEHLGATVGGFLADTAVAGAAGVAGQALLEPCKKSFGSLLNRLGDMRKAQVPGLPAAGLPAP